MQIRTLHIQMFTVILIAQGLLNVACTTRKSVVSNVSETVSLTQTNSTQSTGQTNHNRRALNYFVDGVIAEMTGDVLEAAMYYEAAHRYDSTSETIHASLAGIYVETGQWDKAEKTLTLLISRNPNNTDILESLADLYLQKHEYTRAIETLETICHIDSSQLSPRYKLIALYELQGKYSDMARHYERILRDYQDNIMISVKLGALYLKMKAYDQAIVVYQRALQYDPNNLYLLEALASSYLMIKDYQSALKTFETIIRLKPDDRIVHHRIASLALQLSDYEKALYHYHFIESSSENQSDVQRGIGFSLYQLKRPQEAVSYLEKAARLNDKDVLSMTLLAGIFQDQKDFERSDEYFEKVLRADPENDLILNNYSYSLADRGVHLDKALKMIRRVMEKSPDNSHYLDTYGWVLFRLGRYDQALRYIQKSYDLDSSSWEVAMHLGDIYEQLNQTVKALHYFERALHSGGNQEILKPKIEKLMKERQNEK